jgi:hypothetical protein
LATFDIIRAFGALDLGPLAMTGHRKTCLLGTDTQAGQRSSSNSTSNPTRLSAGVEVYHYSLFELR